MNIKQLQTNILLNDYSSLLNDLFNLHGFDHVLKCDFEQFIDTPGSATLVMNHDVLVGAYDSDTLKRVIYTPSAPGVLVVGTDNVGNVIIPYVIDITNY